MSVTSRAFTEKHRDHRIAPGDRRHRRYATQEDTADGAAIYYQRRRLEITQICFHELTPNQLNVSREIGNYGCHRHRQGGRAIADQTDEQYAFVAPGSRA